MMAELKKSIEKFLDDCRYMRGLSEKTLKASNKIKSGFACSA